MAELNADVERRIVLVTGCTSGGIGHSLAVEFARRKCQVVATARSLSSMADLHSLPLVDTVVLDVLSDESVENAIRTVLDRHGHIDVLVNNAGVHCVGPLAELPIDVIESTFNTNVFGTMRVIKAVVPHMAGRKKGRIVNVGSVSTLMPSPWTGAYTASKAAVHSLSDSLRLELRPFGIDVITVVPGAIKSNLGSNSSAIYRHLPEWRLYKPFEGAIYERVEFSQKPGCTPTDVFANKTVDAVLRRKSSPLFAYGQFSTTASILYYLPIWLKDLIMSRVMKVSTTESAKEE